MIQFLLGEAHPEIDPVVPVDQLKGKRLRIQVLAHADAATRRAIADPFSARELMGLRLVSTAHIQRSESGPGPALHPFTTPDSATRQLGLRRRKPRNLYQLIDALLAQAEHPGDLSQSNEVVSHRPYTLRKVY